VSDYKRLNKFSELNQLTSLWIELFMVFAKSLERSYKELYRSFRISKEGIIFLLNPLIRTAFLTFNNLLRWSLFICFTIFSYQFDSRGGSFIFLEICYSKDYFTGKALLRSFLSLPETPSNLLSCWLSWKSRNANFLCLLLEF
jgi:hypothetical protein